MIESEKHWGKKRFPGKLHYKPVHETIAFPHRDHQQFLNGYSLQVAIQPMRLGYPIGFGWFWDVWGEEWSWMLLAGFGRLGADSRHAILYTSNSMPWLVSLLGS